MGITSVTASLKTWNPIQLNILHVQDILIASCLWHKGAPSLKRKQHPSTILNTTPSHHPTNIIFLETRSKT